MKSNMERHIKRKHPLYAKPSRSARRTSSLSSDVRGEREEPDGEEDRGEREEDRGEREDGEEDPSSGKSSPVTVHNVLSSASSLLPLSNPTLSNKTRAALREVLTSKVNTPLSNGTNHVLNGTNHVLNGNTSVVGPESSALIHSPTAPFDSDTQVSDTQASDAHVSDGEDEEGWRG